MYIKNTVMIKSNIIYIWIYPHYKYLKTALRLINLEDIYNKVKFFQKIFYSQGIIIGLKFECTLKIQ